MGRSGGVDTKRREIPRFLLSQNRSNSTTSAGVFGPRAEAERGETGPRTSTGRVAVEAGRRTVGGEATIGLQRMLLGMGCSQSGGSPVLGEREGK